jgi:two-component system, LytTR family, response regulator
MTLRTVIVDDEPLANERLKLLLADESDVLIVAECGNGEEAVAYLQSQPVDLLFLIFRCLR